MFDISFANRTIPWLRFSKPSLTVQMAFGTRNGKHHMHTFTALQILDRAHLLHQIISKVFLLHRIFLEMCLQHKYMYWILLHSISNLEFTWAPDLDWYSVKRKCSKILPTESLIWRTNTWICWRREKDIRIFWWIGLSGFVAGVVGGLPANCRIKSESELPTTPVSFIHTTQGGSELWKW